MFVFLRYVMNYKHLAFSLPLLASSFALNAADYLSNADFESGIDGWIQYNGADGASSWSSTGGNSGPGCLKVVNDEANPSDQWKTQVHADFIEALPKGEYTLSFFIKCESGNGSVRVSIGNNYEPDQNVSTSYQRINYSFTSQGEPGMNFDLGAVANTYYIDDITLVCDKLAEKDTVAVDPSVYTEVDVNVKWNELNQTVLGFGGGIVYYQNWLTAHPYYDEICDLLFKDMGVSAIRLGNWAQDFNKVDVSHDVKILNTARKISDKDFFIEMSSWSAPSELKANGNLNGTNGGVKASLKKANGQFVYDDFAKWWKKSLLYYQENGIYPDYISIQNEPDMDATYEATIFNEKESDDVASYGKALAAVYNEFRDLEHRPKIIGPEPLGIGWNNLQKYLNAADTDMSMLDGICFHYYHSGVQTHAENQRYDFADDFIGAMKGIANDYYGNKPLIMTENCAMRSAKANDAVNMARIIANAMNYNRTNAYIHWNLIWGGLGEGCISLENPWAPFATEKGYEINGDYYGLCHFAKYVKPGMACLDATSSNSDVVATAFADAKKGTYVIVLVNNGTNHMVNLGSVLSKDSDKKLIAMYRTAPALNENFQDMGTSDIVKDNLIELPANSVVTLTLEMASADKNISADAESWIYCQDGEICFIANKEGKVSMAVYDAQGKKLADRVVNATLGLNKFKLENAHTGIIFVETTIDGILRVDKLICK